MFTYIQKTGEMLEPDGKLLAVGYSGLGIAKNDPAAQMLVGQGPIPVGWYTIELIADSQGNALDYGNKKAPVMRLLPDESNEMFGRSGFLIHGDNATQTASDGCIIQDHSARETIATSGDKRLQVLSGVDEITTPSDLDEGDL